MQKYLQNQTYHHKRDEDFINKVNKINQWRLVEARLIMRYPAVRKILRSIRMTFLTSPEQVGFHYRRLRPCGSGYIVNAMTINTDSDGPRCRSVAEILLLLIELQGNTVKVLEIAVEHCGRKTVFTHQVFVGMAIAAHLRDLLTIVKSPGVQYVMCPVAVCTDRDILIVIVKQGVAVDTRCIYFVNITVTLFASLSACSPVLSCMRYRMRSVAIYADRGVEVPLAEHCIVYAFESFRVFVKMAPPAAFRGGQQIVSLAPENPLRMFFSRKTEMTVRTVKFAVD
jgi:hypothetical protein